MHIKLREIRKKHKFTMQKMADELNITSAFYCQIENNKRILNYKMAVRIATLLNTTPDKLFYKEFKENYNRNQYK